jgi:putative transposase
MTATTLTLSHKIRLTPTVGQEEYLKQACGVARFTWNWALQHWRERYRKGEKPNGLSLKKEFNALKKSEFPWTYDVTKYASQQPFIYLQQAFQRFFAKQGRYPKFKKKGEHDSFYVGCDHIRVKGQRIRLPKLGWVRMREALRFCGRIVSATISRIADKWFVSIHVELHKLPDPCESQAGVGVDLGIRHLATLSDGLRVTGPKPLKSMLARLQRLQRRLSRKQKGSKNRTKARLRVARLHYRIQCQRQDGLHKLTTLLTEGFGTIAVEDLNVSGMMSNRKLARAVMDMGLYEFRRQLEYKARLRGNEIVVANRFFPSSKRCSQCGWVKPDLKLDERTFVCTQCGLRLDRDHNAAINLLSTVSSTGFEACGEESAGSRCTVSETVLCEAGTKP